MENQRFIIRPECINRVGEAVLFRISVYNSLSVPVKAQVKISGKEGFAYDSESFFVSDTAPCTEFFISGVKLWNPENPVMYSLFVVITFTDGSEEKLECPYGFRILERKGKTVTLNGVKIKLLGVAYREHGDFSEVKKDLVKFKEAHINFLRAMYGTFSKELLMWCDENGIFTEDSLPLYCVGTTGSSEEDLPHLKNKYEDAAYALLKKGYFAGRIIISLGHDCSFGQNFRTAGEIIKEIDKISLMTFHLPMSIPEDDMKIDVWAMHYIDPRLPYDRCFDHMTVFHTPGAGNEIGYSAPYNEEGIPVLHEIFAPVPNHNFDELVYDPGVRDFWEKSVLVHTGKILSTDGCLGGAVLAGNDEDDTFQALSGYRWGILDINHEPKNEYFALKKAYEPVKIRKVFKSGKRVILLLEDRLQFTGIEKCLFTVDREKAYIRSIKTNENGLTEIELITEYIEETVKNHFELSTEENPEEKETIKESIKIYLPDGETLISETDIKTLEEAEKKTEALPKIPKSGYGKLHITESKEVITISNGRINAVFCKECGKVKEISLDGKKVITKGPDLIAVNYSLYEWSKESVKAYYDKNEAVVETVGTYRDSLRVRFTVRISENGKIETGYEILKLYRHMPHATKTDIGISSGGINEKGVAYTFAPGFTALQTSLIDNRDELVYLEDAITENRVYPSRHNTIKSFLKAPDGSGVLFSGTENGSIHPVEYPEYFEEAVIDDRDSRVRYEGKWYRVDDYCGNYKNTESMSCEKGAFAEIEFEGTGISLYGCYDMNNGKSEISLDSVTVKNIDEYLPNVYIPGISRGYEKVCRQCIYSVDGLIEGKHTIRLTVMGEKQAAANNCYASFDYAVIRGEKYKSGLTVHQNKEYNYSKLVRGCVRNNPVYLIEGEKNSARLYLIPKGEEMT